MTVNQKVTPLFSKINLNQNIGKQLKKIAKDSEVKYNSVVSAYYSWKKQNNVEDTPKEVVVTVKKEAKKTPKLTTTPSNKPKPSNVVIPTSKKKLVPVKNAIIINGYIIETYNNKVKLEGITLEW